MHWRSDQHAGAPDAQHQHPHQMMPHHAALGAGPLAVAAVDVVLAAAVIGSVLPAAVVALALAAAGQIAAVAGIAALQFAVAA